MLPYRTKLVTWLGKIAADSVTKKTVRSLTVKPGTREAQEAMNADLKPAAQVAPTRYGRKPYARSVERDST
jgi:hypothetical protein